MGRPDEVLVRGARYLIVETDEGRLDVLHAEHQRNLGSLEIREGGVWGLLDGDYELTRDIAARVREGRS